MGIFDCDCACADYSGVAAASSEGNKVGEKLGQDQLAEARRQYDNNMAVTKPVVDSQLALMKQTKDQGDDYYNYMKSKQRPVEDALNAESLTNRTAQDQAERDAITNAGLIRQEDVDAHMAKIQGMRDKLAMGRDDAYQADKSNIDAGINRAVADVNQQGSAAIGQNNRALAAYGINPNSGRFVSADRNAAMQQAAMGAGAANTAREAGIADFKNRTAGSLAGENEDFTQKSAIGLQRASTLSNTRNMRLQDDATGWAKKLDVAGLYRNLTGASQGAYGLSTSAGNSAVGNNASAGNALMSGLSSGTNTIMSGKQTQINGLLGAANGEQAGFNAQAQTSGSAMSGLGSLVGAGLSAYKMGLIPS